MRLITFSERAKYTANPTAKTLFHLMEKKQTNLCLSVDLTRTDKLLALAAEIGPEICVLKTHIDILEDFRPSFLEDLTVLSKKYDFLIFEDRKFADIGNTVKAQYGKGIYRIADWAAISNAHTLPGDGIIEGLKTVGLPKGNGLLLLAQMSAKGNLIQPSYTQATVALAKVHKDFVIGFISQQRLTEDPAFIHFTPGINQTSQGDALGQQYTTPRQAILERDNDIAIVGRGIYEAANPLEAAKVYRQEAWAAYLAKL